MHRARRRADARRSPASPIPLLWRRRHKDGRWIWLEGVATNLLDDPSVRAIVTNYRDITERLEHESRLGEQLQRLALLSRITHAIGERQDLPQHLPGGGRAARRRAAGGFLLHLPLRRRGENRLHGDLRRRTQRRRWRAARHATRHAVPIDENGLSRCVHGHLVYEPDIAAVAVPVPAAPRRSGGLRLDGDRAAAGREPGVRRAGLRARRGRTASAAPTANSCARSASTSALAAHQAQLYTALQQAYDDLRQTQQPVMQQERLRALGQMASGIAHDINNAISPVALYTEALLEREPNLTEPRRATQLDIIQRAIDDVAADRGAHARVLPRMREPQLGAGAGRRSTSSVRQVLDLTRARWSDMAQQRGVVIDMRTDLADRPAADRGAWRAEIREALINLVFNAVDAMPQGGPLTIRTRLARRQRPRGRAARGAATPASAWTRTTRAALPRAVLHHQGRARHRPRAGDGLRRRAAARRRPRDRQRARQGHDDAACSFAVAGEPGR